MSLDLSLSVFSRLILSLFNSSPIEYLDKSNLAKRSDTAVLPTRFWPIWPRVGVGFFGLGPALVMEIVGLP